MLKKVTINLLLSFLVGFILFGGFQSYLLAGSKHLVDTGELREAIVESSQARLSNIEKLEKRLTQWGFDASQVKTTVRTLTNSELEYLVYKSENTGGNFFGGADAGKTIGLIGLAGMAAFIIYWEVGGLTQGTSGDVGG